MLLDWAELRAHAVAKMNECSLECVDLSHPPTSFSRPHRALMVSGAEAEPDELLPAIRWNIFEGVVSGVEYPFCVNIRSLV